MQMNKVLLFHIDSCTGCGLCESVCSLVHTRTTNPARSRIRVVREEPEGVYIPTFCQQCEDAPCIAACPTVAIGRNQLTGAIEVDRDLCALCEQCIEACPFRGIYPDEIDQVVIACDLCGGAPNCVLFCETKALECLESDAAVAQKKQQALQDWRERLSAVEEQFQSATKQA